jgi:hypothetical protein
VALSADDRFRHRWLVAGENVVEMVALLQSYSQFLWIRYWEIFTTLILARRFLVAHNLSKRKSKHETLQLARSDASACHIGRPKADILERQVCRLTTTGHSARQRLLPPTSDIVSLVSHG